VVDAYTNIYAPLLPLLIPRLNLSLATAGTLAMCFQLANSVSQLGFGALADRWRPRVLVIAGPLVAVLMLSLVGLATSPLILGVVLVCGGFGGAAFHPPAAALVYKLAEPRNKGTAMSAHLSGGSLGFSLAPILFAPFIAAMGLGYSPLIMIPGLIALSWTLRQVPPMELPHKHERSTWATLKPAAVPLSLLYFTIVLRTATTYGFMTFTPTLLTQSGFTIAEASTAVSLYLFASGIGGFLGGPVADRVGPRRVIVWTMITAVPFMALAPHLPPIGFTTMLAIGGFLLQSTLPISVTFAQTFVKSGAATVSSLMMGFAWGMGSLTVPLIGMGADRFGIQPTLAVVAFIPLLGAALAWRLPEKGTFHIEPKVDSLP